MKNRLTVIFFFGTVKKVISKKKKQLFYAASDMIERVHKKFFRTVVFRLKIPCAPVTTVIIHLGHDRALLQIKGIWWDLYYLPELLSNQIAFPPLLAEINFFAPRRHQSPVLLYPCVPRLPFNLLLNNALVLQTFTPLYSILC